MGGELRDTSLSGYGLYSNDWDPTECSKPYEPSVIVYDVDSYNDAVRKYNNFLREADRYLRCVSSEAIDDSKTVDRLLTDGVEEERDDMARMIDSLKSRLDMELLLLN